VKRLTHEGFWALRRGYQRARVLAVACGRVPAWRFAGQEVAREAVNGVEEVYQLAADMGGAGDIFTGDHDAAVMHNSATINLNILEYGYRAGGP